MGRIKLTKLALFIICLVLAFSNLLLSCDNLTVYSSIRNEIAQSRKIVASGFYPSEPCIDIASPIKIVFDKSIDPDSVELSGSIATSLGKTEWSTTNSTNDTLTLTPLSKWKADTTISTETASLYVKGKDAEGWPCCNIEWKPEILDKAIYVNDLYGNDNDKGSGSSTKPFKTLIYALNQGAKLYTNTTPRDVYLARGVYYICDENIEFINGVSSPTTIKGGYSNTDWQVRDVEKYESIITGYSNKTQPATVTFYKCDGAVLDGLTIRELTYYENHSNFYCGVMVRESNIKMLDCKVETYSDSEHSTKAIYVHDNASLTMENCIINATYTNTGTNDKDDSVAIVSRGSLFLSDCLIDVTDLFLVEDHNCVGILSTGNTDIKNSKINIHSVRQANTIAIDLNDDFNKKSIIKLLGNTITIDSFLEEKLKFVIGLNIKKENHDKLLIDSNKINIECDVITVGEVGSVGMMMRNTNDAIIQNNIINVTHGNQNLGLLLLTSKNIAIYNNTFYLDNKHSILSSSKQINSGADLKDSSSASFIGNLFIGLGDIEMSKYSIGITCNMSDDIITQLKNNAFININKYLVVKDIDNIIYYEASSVALSALNNDYKDIFGKSADNLYYSKIEETGISWTNTVPLKPSFSTPQIITQSTLEVAPATDILGNARTIPYSIGAYEVD